MNFILPFTMPRSVETIGYDQKILCIGSCFAEEIGQLLANHQFDTMINPHGILYNSISIARAIQEYMDNRKYVTSDLEFENNLWHSLNHHGSFSNASSEGAIEKINREISGAHDFLKKADWLFITLGSSWGYRYIPSNRIVANCHKIPQHSFTKEIIHATQQGGVLLEKIKLLRTFNPKLKILFTVSPVKYIRDGVVENSLSKANLISTAHSLCNFNEECHYFPGFEIVNDILRDYRFYKEDMVHPNEQAIKYVWEQFMFSYLDQRDKTLFMEIDAWLKYSRHKPLHDSEIAANNKKVSDLKSGIDTKLAERKATKSKP